VGLGDVHPLKAVGILSPADAPSMRGKLPDALLSAQCRAPASERLCEDADTASAEAAVDPNLTTVMLRNLPNNYTRDMLVQLLDDHGFAAHYDFLYLPVDFGRRAGLGYAFVNMISVEEAQRVRSCLEGFRQWSLPSSKVCSVGWSSLCQGLAANIERYRNSPVMHRSVPDEFKPLLLVEGRPVPFPQPTKKVRRP